MTNEKLVLTIQQLNTGERSESLYKLYQQNEGLIKTAAAKRAGLCEFEDLMQEGFIAIVKAAEGYKAEYNTLFATYATLIVNQHFDNYIKDNARSVRIPRYLLDRAYRLKRMENSFFLTVGRKPTLEEKSNILELSPEQITAIEIASKEENSLDYAQEAEDGEDGTLLNLLPDSVDIEREALTDVLNSERRKAVYKALDGLSDGEKELLEERYLNHSETLTRRAVARNLNISEDQARTLEEKAFRKMKKPSLDLDKYIELTPRSCDTRGTGLTSFRHTWTSQPERDVIKRLGLPKQSKNTELKRA